MGRPWCVLAAGLDALAAVCDALVVDAFWFISHGQGTSFHLQHVENAYLCGMTDTNLKQKAAGALMWGGLSQAAQQALNLVFGIVLARLLSPADYGMVGMLTIFALIATSLQESGFMSALTRKQEASSEDYNAVFWFNVLCSLTVYAVLFAAAPLIAAWFRQPVLVPLSRLLFLSFVFSAMGTAPRAWLFRHMRAKQTAVISLTSLVVSGLCGITLAWLGFAYWGIALQNLVFCASVSLGGWYFSEWRPTWRINLRPLRGMIGFSSRLLATNIFTHVNNNLFSLFFGRLYGESTVGYYNQANKWTTMGHSTLTGMVWSVTQPLFARLSYDEPQRQQAIFRKMLRLTAFLSCPCMFGLALVAPEFITLTITEKWLSSALLMQYLCIGGAFVPIASFCSNFLISQGKSQVYMWNTVSLCLVQLLLLVVLHPYGVRCMVVAYVAANTLWLLVWHVFVRRIIGLRLSLFARDILPFAALAGMAMGAAWGVAHLCPQHLLVTLLVKVAVAAVVYALSLRLLGARIMQECWDFVREKIGLRR